jgi:hypothetical protein
MYADDGLLFDITAKDFKLNELNNEEKGLIINESKSGWVKKDGV